jgi:hypothetical protein
MDEVYRTVNFDIHKSGVLQMLNQSSFREDPHFQRCAGASVKYEIVELLNYACPCFVSQHERTVPGRASPFGWMRIALLSTCQLSLLAISDAFES